MNPQPQIVVRPNEGKPSEADLIDRIAELLPSEQRPLWYREMAHQREQLTVILDRSVTAILAAERNVVALHQQLEQRITQLPEEITAGISPTAIAAKISESLRQQFVQSGIPETAQALAVIARQNKQTAADFDSSAKQLSDSYKGAVTNANQAIGAMRIAMSNAAETAERAANDLVHTFLGHYKWALHWLVAAGIALGFALGIIYAGWRDAPPETRQPASSTAIQPSPQSASPIPPIAKRTREKRLTAKPNEVRP